MGSGPHITAKQERLIIADLLQGRMKTRDIAEKHGVHYNTANRLMHRIIHKVKPQYAVFLGGKNEPYQTEEEALSCPLYTAQNKHLIKEINPDWKLF